ncbi:hypothetical protein CLAIMM_15184 [Cladophialophora immunda]|nr:hypothetical protein CLAIMM_15184 [Cladophialophora immunda]
MAGSNEMSTSADFEDFWKLSDRDLTNLTNDDTIKILTAGVKNMSSIAKCAQDLLSENALLQKYLTYQRLVKVLDFVSKGARLLHPNPKSDPLTKTIDDFAGLLDDLKGDLAQEDDDQNKIPNSSAIELLLELFYKAMPEVPEDIDEFVLAFEARFGKYFTQANHCGLPSVVFICFAPHGIIITATAARWQLSLENNETTPNKREVEFDGVKVNMRRMRNKRFQFSLTEKPKQWKLFEKAHDKWRKPKNDHTMSYELQKQHFEGFDHLTAHGGAFHVLAGAGSILEIYAPCIKCRYLHRFAYIGPKPIDNRLTEGRCYYGNCAEDLCHELLLKNKALDRQPNTSLC